MQRFISLLLLGGIGVPAAAQTSYLQGQQPPHYLQLAYEATREVHPLIAVAHLNEAEYVRLRHAQERLLTRREQVLREYAPDSPVRPVLLHEVQVLFEQERQRALTPSQLSLLPDQLSDPLPPDNGNGLGLQAPQRPGWAELPRAAAWSAAPRAVRLPTAG
ncbi:hypothetical protein EJV47_04080 [Hymenobacter gummosus]|uniref:Uncharacterized protein n=1 Tax=Hymenobacter gummosus TaxID=1776032 RepID=A0A3S0JJD7_9BACT|nr:hypothetical protein [Hymenobacter gummosus]RTQ52214.1 hypothetical protein EJV47_04080 [Hymenobacter gummosus]